MGPASHKHASHRHASRRRASPTGGTVDNLTNDLCAKYSARALEFAPPDPL
jgi:hypothetical protein